MKRLPLRLKITLWFTVAMLLVTAFTYVAVLYVSNQILQKTIQDNLIEAVEENYSEVRYYSSIDEADLSRDASHFLEFQSGFLEVDDDFLEQVNGVYTALYNSDAALLYGENPISRHTATLKFRESRLQRIRIDGTNYYVFDRKLTLKNLDGLWLRGVVSEKQGTTQMNTITRASLLVLPGIVLIASVGGYFIIKRMLAPLRKMSETAQRIGRENDLKQRIDLDGSSQELQRLADTFNDMLDKLDKAADAERRFISDASHELRTPMTVILAQCEFSLEKPRSGEEYEESFRVIHRQGRRMAKMINGMLDFTRLDAGTDRYTKEAIDLTQLVDSVCGDMALIREKGIELEWDAEAGITLMGNYELLTRLLINLIGNAYRYGRENGHIRVRLQRDAAGAVELSVADDGIGIAEEDRDKIFRRFYQSDSSRSGEGIGLGLSMASEIARFHGGAITVESEPGRGSVFYVRFPKK